MTLLSIADSLPESALSGTYSFQSCKSWLTACQNVSSCDTFGPAFPFTLRKHAITVETLHVAGCDEVDSEFLTTVLMPSNSR